MVRSFAALLAGATAVLGLSAEYATEKRARDNTSPYLRRYIPDSHGLPPKAWITAIPGSDNPPDTGATRTYSLTVSRETASPDNVSKPSLLVNHGNTGPLIEANWGDWVQVTVRNNITTPGDEDGFAMHWHGLLQRSTPWYDGVPGVSQCPIAPGKSFTYLFRADQAGTSWYHSHYTAQYTDGAFGPMVFYGPDQRGVTYDNDLGMFLFHDYTHFTYERMRDDSFMQPPRFNNLSNNLLNGHGCDLSTGACRWETTKLPTHRVKVGDEYRLRLVNAGGAGAQKISVDGHNLTVFAYDYVQIKPYVTDTVTLGIGQRADVILRPRGKKTDAVYLRGVVDAPCTNGSAVNDEARAIILFDKAKEDSIPTNSATPWDSNRCRNDPLSLMVPSYSQRPPPSPAVTQEIAIDAIFNSTGSYLFILNNRTFRTDYNRPILLDTSLGDLSSLDDPDRVIFNFGANSSVRVVLYNHAPFAHPMHIHGHNFWALAEGFGRWDGVVTNGDNPARRDTVLMPPGSPEVPSYLVVEWVQDNPGIWPIHCHITLHNGHGLFMNAMERPKDIMKGRGKFPESVEEGCREWERWSRTNVVDQTDSGV